MNEKELKEIAMKIANLEKIIQKSTNQEEIKKCELDIELLCMQVRSLEDFWVLDEMINEILS